MHWFVTFQLFIYSIEDDEFEEFDPAHWNKDAMEEETQQQWMENWDDDMENCDFTKNLREELQKSSKWASREFFYQSLLLERDSCPLLNGLF